MEHILKEAGRIIGSVSQQDFESTGVYDLLIEKLHHVLDDVSHPLHNLLSCQLIARSGSMRLLSAVTSRYLSSFGLYRIQHHNANIGVKFQLDM